MNEIEMRKEEHFGVYVAIERDEEILLVKKNRGPYTGTMDLPGGAPEFGESPIETVMREIQEELGFVIEKDCLELSKVIGFLHKMKDGMFYHKGVVFAYAGKIDEIGDGSLKSSDTDGFRWVSKTSDELSPLTREYLQK